jgi:carboxymethylenebutenolidase
MTIRTQREIRTADGVTEAHFIHPEGNGPWPGVLLFMDGLGMRPVIRDMAERFASNGYYVVAPNVLYRSGNFAPFDVKSVWGNDEERNRLMAIIKAFDVPSAIRDLPFYLDALKAEPQAIADKVGCVGYCLGGRMAFVAAGNFPDRVAAAASIHGGGLVTDAPESPHTKAGQIKASLYFGVADNDPSATPEHQAALVTALSTAHVDYRLELYAGKSHGFAVADTPIYDAAASERHYARVLDLFGSALPQARA